MHIIQLFMMPGNIPSILTSGYPSGRYGPERITHDFMGKLMKSKNFLLFACALGAMQMLGCAEEAATAFEPSGEGVCGDGQWNNGEICDDGNLTDGDGCSSTCQLEDGYTWTENGVVETLPAANCGNGMIELGEVCDDNNNKSGDGCMSNCLAVEEGYKCKKPGQPCTRIESCGNGKLDQGEACDDADPKAKDGCENCKAKDGWVCDETGCFESSETETARCGDGVREGNEQCDDHNTDNGDCCSSTCRIEPACACNSNGTSCYPVNNTYVCGDGSVDPNEECDDGNEFSDDGCFECVVEAGWRCTHDPGDSSICYKKFCGDGSVDEDLGEKCDDGQNNVDYHADAGHCTKSCQPAPHCGDGTQNGSEACDDGELNGTPQSPNSCSKKCSIDPHCGDGRVDDEELGEVCDEGENNGVICAADCKSVKHGYICDKAGSAEGGIGCIEITCGNGRQDDGEQCDEGGYANTDGCKYCQKAPGYNCKGFGPGTCYTINYSDGKIESGYEDCDDGNDKSGDGCYRGEVEKGWFCTGTPSVCIAKACGDGVVAGDEECDDGNTNTADGCNNFCEIEASYACTINASGKSTCQKGRCGDGKVQKGEACDDGDTNDTNGCSNTCMLTAGYQCPITGGKCVTMTCGDSSIKPKDGYVGYEQCDDGKTQAGDGCSATCTLEDHYYCANDACTRVTRGTCGDGIVGGGEQCDDGNNKGADGCSPTCQIEAAFYCKNTAYNDRNSLCSTRCGDGLTMWMLTGPGKEECDDGNLVNGDGCSSDCKVEDGYTCTEFTEGNYPDHIEIPVTYRDFRGRDTKGSGSGYQTAAWINELKKDTTCNRNIKKGTGSGTTTADWLYTQSYNNMGDSSKYAENVPLLLEGTGHPDFQGFSGNVCQGIAADTLSKDGKPVYAGKSLSSKCFIDNNSGTSNSFTSTGTNSSLEYGHHILCGPSFNTWFRTDSRINQEINSKLYLARSGEASSNTYVFDSDNPPAAAVGAGGQTFLPKYFSPIDGVGYKDMRSVDNQSRKVNGNFTTEIHTFFQYKGGETLTFSGDDDVWVYINGKLFVDLGGMHGRQEMTNELKRQSCSNGQKCDPAYEIYEGGIYDIHMFQAEREYTGSNFRLTLDGFLNTGAATCKAVCGDGIVAPTEACDYDTKRYTRNDYEILGCHYPGTANECQLTTNSDGKHAVCGNGRIEEGEACDTGHLCMGSSLGACEGITYKPDSDCIDCKYANCGNGQLDGNEQCDKAKFSDEAKALANCTDATCQCSDACRVIYCGDGIVNNGEECDDGNTNNEDSCTTHCKAPYCGDGIKSISLGEACDDGENNGTYGHCLFDCSAMGPRCGDGKVQAGDEECDLGKANSDKTYNGCGTDCKYGLRCGDDIVTPPYEECDDGDNNGSETSRCLANCTSKPIY